MRRVLVLVEGQTEEVFVNQVVAPVLDRQGLHLIPKILTTNARKDGRQFKGGVSSFARLRRDLLRLLGDTGVAAVTTMFDYYGIPRDFPGLDDAPAGDAYRRVEHLERALRANLDHPKLLPYLSVHEFEALVLAGPDELAKTLLTTGGDRGLRELRDVLGTVESPERINDGETTHPSARLQQWFPRYQKTLHGRLVTARIGLPRLRRACPHFDAWIAKLEQVS